MTSSKGTPPKTPYEFTPGEVTMVDCDRALEPGTQWAVSPSAWPAVQASQQAIQTALKQGGAHYGINTGFGLLANTAIADDQLQQLQLNIVRSHCTGVGPPLDRSTVRLMLLLKANALARGYSGVRREVIEALLALLNHDCIPVVPSQGSVGASGDLAPLAHLSAVLIGEGHAWVGDTQYSGKEALVKVGLKPLELQPKEGLALLNGTQASTALAMEACIKGWRLLRSAVVIGALTVEAVRGSRAPLMAAIHQVRGHAGQIAVAEAFRELLQPSEISQSHANCGKVQDPYSIRCQPQVLGACWEALNHGQSVLTIEANGVTDNPLVFTENSEAGVHIVSGGNFHAEPVAMVADYMALAIAEIGSLAERRIALMMDAQLSQLPPFLVESSGVNSGFMMAQVTAAALVSENKTMAYPASVDSIPTSANQEDHVSMATHGARRLHAMMANAEGVLAIEWLCACQGLDLLGGLQSAPLLEQALTHLREHVPMYVDDRAHSDDIQTASALIRRGVLARAVVL